jgi:hypothetical protein
MAGYVPESMKEVQGLIAKAYADTVLNAFLGAPELLSIAPVGGKMNYDEQLEYLRKREQEVRQEKESFVSLCNVALIEGELMLRYARNRKLTEEDINWLEDKAELFDADIASGIKELIEDVKNGNFITRARRKKLEAQKGLFSFGKQEWNLHPESPVRKYFEFLYSVVEGFDPSDVAELQRRNYEISGLADVATYGYEILAKLCEKAGKLDSSVFISAVMPKGYLAKAKRTYDEGRTPKPMYKPIVLSGPPGVGKTAILREIASWTKTNLFSFSMAQMDAASFGFPVYDSITGSAKRDILDDMKNTVKDPGVVLLDEMNRAGTDIQSKLLTYLLDHKVSGFTVHPLSLVVGAENPISADLYGTMTKSIAMIDRCLYIDMSNYDMIVDGWFEWLEEEYKDVIAESDILRSFIRFLKEEPPQGARDIILKIPEDPEENPGFPTPRSIDAAITSIILSHGDVDTATTEITANVGSELGNRFASYLEVIRALPSPQELANKADKIPSVLAAVAVDSDMRITDGVTVVGFEKGLFNTINGYDDGSRGKKSILEEYGGNDDEFRNYLKSLTPQTAAEEVEKCIKDLYSSNSFTVGVEAEMADSILAAFQKSFRDSIENDKPIDTIFLGNLFKAACFFPVPTVRNNLLNMMERTILLIPWKEKYSDALETLDKLCKAEVKTRSGVKKINVESPFKAFYVIVPPAPWLIKVSKRFKDAFKEVEELIAERDGQDEIRIG